MDARCGLATGAGSSCFRDVRFGNRRRQVAVALRHPDAGAAEQIADDEQRRPPHDEVARVRVTKRVRPERGDAGSPRDAVEAIRQVVSVVLRAVGPREDVRT